MPDFQPATLTAPGFFYAWRILIMSEAAAPQINLPAGFNAVVNADGSITVQANGSMPTLVKAVGAYVSARAAESSTKIGAIAGAAAAPTLSQNIVAAVTCAAARDYVGAAVNGIPALIGVIGAFAAIFMPEKSKALTPEQVRSALAALPSGQLASLFSAPAPAPIYASVDQPQ